MKEIILKLIWKILKHDYIKENALLNKKYATLKKQYSRLEKNLKDINIQYNELKNDERLTRLSTDEEILKIRNKYAK